MLISMTGFGSASTREEGYVLACEIKAVNNRFLKTSIRLPDGFAPWETKLDELLHKKIARGSVYFSMKVEREAPGVEFEICDETLRRYLESLRRFQANCADVAREIPVGSLAEFLRAPGVVQDNSRNESDDLNVVLWKAAERVANEALDALETMRRAEGNSTERYLNELLVAMRGRIDAINALAPTVVEAYRVRLTERVSKILAENNANFDPASIIREIAVYTDRVDISEEIARFYSHLDQFAAAMATEAACGKKLDFITQEMFRETNTIGSKTSSPDALKIVVELKSDIERVREMVQNVE